MAVVVRGSGHRLHLGYYLHGALDNIRLPATASAARRDGLWQCTCFELFIGSANDERYREYNFSPSGEWAAYAFDRYRSAAALPDVTPPVMRWMRSADRLGLEVSLTLPQPPPQDARLGVTAIIQTVDSSLSYWALHHPLHKPDFHHREGFTLTLPRCD